MGWIEKVKDIIGGLRASGKSEKEIEDIVQQESDKATMATAIEAGEAFRVMLKSLGFATMQMAEAAVALSRAGWRQQESNNWRKMHGLPMRRKGKRRR